MSRSERLVLLHEHRHPYAPRKPLEHDARRYASARIPARPERFPSPAGFATRGTQQFLSNAGIAAKVAHWPDEDASPNTVALIRQRVVDLVINIPKDLSATELSNDYQIRRSAVDYNIPLITNARLASAFINAFCSVPESEMEIKAWDEY